MRKRKDAGLVVESHRLPSCNLTTDGMICITWLPLEPVRMRSPYL
jgi:hypothetical protein